jgi:L-lactate dehydrogenase complex protein LldG
MSNRNKILAAVKANQPGKVNLPDINLFETGAEGSLKKFAAVLTAVGGNINYVCDYDEIARLVVLKYGDKVKIVNEVKKLTAFTNSANLLSVHDLHDVEVAILPARLGVAENGAVWITDHEMRQRALPFICQHLAVVLFADNLVSTMHDAYEAISKTTYNFGTFIAGPSKTADIEQSLVIGAHGPRSFTMFVLPTDAGFNA